MEVTAWTEALPCNRTAVGRFSKHVVRSVCECRAGLENLNAVADPSRVRGRLPATGNAKALDGTKHRSPPPG